MLFRWHLTDKPALCRTFGHAQLDTVECPGWSARSSRRTRAPASGSRKDSLSDGDQICARTQEVVGVTAALYPTHPDDGDPNARPHLRDLRERDRADRRTGHAAGLPAEPRLARPVRMWRHPAQRVDQ